jgi:hypothetical protein
MDAFKKAMDQAQQAAQQAAAQAKVAGGQVQEKLSDPATQAQAKVQMAKAGVEAKRVAVKARRGVTTIIEKIDPGLLADVVIKATSSSPPRSWRWERTRRTRSWLSTGRVRCPTRSWRWTLVGEAATRPRTPRKSP